MTLGKNHGLGRRVEESEYPNIIKLSSRSQDGYAIWGLISDTSILEMPSPAPTPLTRKDFEETLLSGRVPSPRASVRCCLDPKPTLRVQIIKVPNYRVLRVSILGIVIMALDRYLIVGSLGP